MCLWCNLTKYFLNAFALFCFVFFLIYLNGHRQCAESNLNSHWCCLISSGCMSAVLLTEPWNSSGNSNSLLLLPTLPSPFFPHPYWACEDTQLTRDALLGIYLNVRSVHTLILHAVLALTSESKPSAGLLLLWDLCKDSHYNCLKHYPVPPTAGRVIVTGV